MKKTVAAALCLSAVLLSGCVLGPGNSREVPAETPEVTAAPSAVETSATEPGTEPGTVTPTPVPTPTPTPKPTPEPTPIPTPTPVRTPGPTPEPKPRTLEDVDALLRENGAVCGVAYLGRSADSLAIGAPALLAVGGYNWLYPFLGTAGSVQMVEWNGSEVYAVIPRSDARVSIYAYILSRDGALTSGPGAFIASSQGWQPILLRCNDSVTMPNTMLIVEAPGEAQVRFVPWATLSDGSLIDSDSRILDLTIDGFKLG